MAVLNLKLQEYLQNIISGSFLFVLLNGGTQYVPESVLKHKRQYK